MHSPTAALLLQIWTRRRIQIWFVIGITLFSGVFGWIYGDALRAARASRFSTGVEIFAELLIQHLLLATLLLTLGIFNYTEFNSQKGSAGFPHRLFVLPVSSFRLVAVPMAAGVAAMVLPSLIWLWIFQPESLAWAPSVGFASFMLFYQGISWMLPGRGGLRMLILGVFAFSLFAIPIVFSTRRIPEGYALALIAGFGAFSFFASWIHIARQRSGGGWNREWIKMAIEWLSDRMPRRRTPFRSAAAAQFWFEWRRAGLVLPNLVAGLLIGVIGPIASGLRGDVDASLRILLAAVALPIILALPVGKAFSKPDFWSGDLVVPTVYAVRPLTNSDIVLTKMKVAAVSAALSWLLVLLFLFIWLSLWADFGLFLTTRNVLWQMFGQSVYPQYAIALFLIFLGLALTWRFLVANLWLGLYGRKVLFGISAFPYAIAPFVGFAGLILIERNEESIFTWTRNNLNGFLPQLVWIAASVLIAKLWCGAIWWRRARARHVHRYLLWWAGASIPLVLLAILLSTIASALIPGDIYRIRNLLILGALLVMPLARVGLAESTLGRNRHRL